MGKRGPKPIPAEVRMWRYIEKTDGCWNWTGKVDKRGYGTIGGPDQTWLRAHRLSYEVHVGPIPSGKSVLHHCDNRICVNPEHLYVGTHADNTRDMMERKRSGWHVAPEKVRHAGETNGRAVLTADQVRYIRTSTERGKDLAERFGVGTTAIYDIKLGKSWKSLR